MRTSSKQFHSKAPSDEPEVILTDDGGSGLFEACNARFPSPDYEVKCDARHTVWVKRADGTRSVGLPPWVLSRHSLSEVLERAEEKIALPVAGR
jgi:hypothetical protein